MCSEIDERTRENPGGAMVHQPGVDYLLYTPQFQQQLAFARAQQNAWPWPVSGAQEAMHALVAHDMPICSPKVEKPEAQHFDTEAHRAFMRSLG
jgi:hypothetical protein